MLTLNWLSLTLTSFQLLLCGKAVLLGSPHGLVLLLGVLLGGTY